MITQFYIFENKGNTIGPLYHGSDSVFNEFSSEKLGDDNHLLSYLGCHFTPNFDMAQRLFARKPNPTVYTVEITVVNPLKITENRLVRNMIKWGYDNDYFDKKKIDMSFVENSLYDSPNGGDLNTALWCDNGPNQIINKRKLSLGYKNNFLIPQGYDSIEYLNEIEWVRDKRYDWIVFNNNRVKIINRVKI